MHFRKTNLFVAAVVLFASLVNATFKCSAQQAVSVLPKGVDTLVKNLPADTDVGIVVLDRRGRVVFQHNAETEFPAASSIKAPLLLELFAKYADELDETDRDDIAAIVTDDESPAISHFSKKSRSLIAEELAGVSIKQLGKILVDSTDQSGKKYANVVYNAAANVAIALLGGPEGATKAIQERHEDLKQVNVRRYMLAKRSVTGDNTASPKALATLFKITIGKKPKGMKASTVKQIAEILHTADYKTGAKLYSKGGTLYSDPVTKVNSGQYHKGKIRMNYAIMATQKLKSPKTGKTQYKTLSKLATDIYDGLKNPK